MMAVTSSVSSGDSFRVAGFAALDDLTRV